MMYYLLMIGANQLITIGFNILEKRTSFGSWNFLLRQIVIGVVFGIFGCVATELVCMVQVPLSNVRDAFPITAGLLFGGRAGIISGLICGVYRFFSPTLIAGNYTRISCSITAVFAGVAAALMRKYFFKRKSPTIFLAFLFTITIEAFHMSMIFLTHTSDLAGAFELVKAACFKVMIANALSVSIAVILYRFCDYKFLSKVKIAKNCPQEKKAVSGVMTFFIMFFLIGAFILVGYFLFAIHTGFTKNSIIKAFSESIEEVENKINKNDEITKDVILDELFSYTNYMVDELLLVDSNSKEIYNYEDYYVFPLEDDSVPGKLCLTNFYDYDTYYMYEEFQDFYIIATVDKDSVMFFRDSTVYMVGLLNIIVFSILFFSSYVLLKTNVISNMRNLIEAMVKAKNNGLLPETGSEQHYFMSISKELNYTFKLLYKQYNELSGQMMKEHEKKEQFEYMAEHDKLTGVLNREGFKKTVCPLTDNKSKIAFLFIDVDKFKGINDTYGHIKGDKILQKVAKCIKDDSRGCDIIMRYGGDEFALIMLGCGIKDKERIIHKIKNINENLKNPDDGLPPVTISVGAAFSERGFNKDVMQEADRALYVTKENGRAGCFCSDVIIK